MNPELCDHQILTILQTRRPAKRNAWSGLGISVGREGSPTLIT